MNETELKDALHSFGKVDIRLYLDKNRGRMQLAFHEFDWIQCASHGVPPEVWEGDPQRQRDELLSELRHFVGISQDDSSTQAQAFDAMMWFFITEALTCLHEHMKLN